MKSVEAPSRISPLSGESRVEVEKVMPSVEIVARYARTLGIDVSGAFADVPTVELCRCRDSRLGFFLPRHIVGGTHFYDELGAKPWYYQPRRWEHASVLSDLPQRGRILEIGCGHGEFLEDCRARGLEVCGLEFSPAALAVLQRRGVPAFDKPLSALPDELHGAFDTVCAFQVLEHVNDVSGFLNGAARLLKTGGSFYVAVPNNEAWLRGVDEVLNFPPHHVNLWDSASLVAVPAWFPFRLNALSYEPLQPTHINQHVMASLFPHAEHRLGGLTRKLLVNQVARLGRWAITATKSAQLLRGLTVLAHFEKTDVLRNGAT